MKRFLKWSSLGAVSLIAVAVLFVIGNLVYAQTITGNTDYWNMFFFNNNCSGLTPRNPGVKGAQVCFDTTSLSMYIWSGSAFVGAASGNALIIKSPTAMCTTSNTVGALCAEPTVTLSPGFADGNYAISCTCASVGTNVPVVEAVAKSTNAIVVSIAALTAASASCAEVDCIPLHP